MCPEALVVEENAKLEMIMPMIQNKINLFQSEKESEQICTILEKIEKTPDLLVFGWKEVDDYLQQGLLCSVFTNKNDPALTETKKEIMKSVECQLIVMEGQSRLGQEFIARYPCVAQKWFASTELCSSD